MGKIRHAEEFVYQLVEDGQLEIEADGSIWRVAIRTGDRWTKSAKVTPCERRRAENRAGNYLTVRAMIDGKRVTALAHRLVWRHLHGPLPPDMTVNHKNGNKKDNRPDNLELATDSEQQLHAVHVLGTAPTARQWGERNPGATLTTEQVAEMRTMRKSGATCSTIAARYGVPYQTVWSIVSGRSRSRG